MAEDKEFNLDAQSVPDADEVQEDTEAVVVEEEAAPSEAEKSEDTVVEEEPSRVPYSRFETVHERAIRAEAEAAFLKQQLEQSKQTVQPPYSGDLPQEWVELWGDNETSRKAFAVEQRRIAKIEESVAEKAIERLQLVQQEREKQSEEVADSWTAQFDDYASKSKRTFTDDEQSAILDVMDELTHKDDKGNYLTNPIDYLPQAVEIYDFRTDRALASKKAAKQRTAQLTSAKGEGEPNGRSGQWTGNWEKSPLLRG